LLYLMPEAVRMDRAVPGGLARYHGQTLASSRYVEIDRVQSQLYLRVKDVNASSVTGGDPTRRADPAIGRALVERTADALVRLVDWFRAHPAAGRP
jgi:creatinine amidohydrolase/Fe(II)-dependent formamide hydrolase-like protein